MRAAAIEQQFKYVLLRFVCIRFANICEASAARWRWANA